MNIRMNLYFLSLLIFASFLFGACSDDCVCVAPSDETYDSWAEMAAAAQSMVIEISVDSLKAKIAGAEYFFIVDVREAGEYEQGAIVGTLNVPRGILESKILTYIEGAVKTDDFVLYCKSGKRSALAALSLKKLGFARLTSLQGGYLA